MWMILAAIQAAAMPVAAGVDEDLTCLAALMTAASQAPEQRDGLQLGMMYFIGRIDRAAPGLHYLPKVKLLVKNDGGRLKAALPVCYARVRTQAELLSGAAPVR